MKSQYKTAITASISAGRAILDIYYNKDLQIERKEDDSPLTIADKNANDIINEFLIPTGIPIISEENQQTAYKERKGWEQCWIVDPLDGTKEFIKGNGEFTVNIALIEDQKPIFGVIYVPVTRELYWGDVENGKSFKLELDRNQPLETQLKNAEEIKPRQSEDKIRVVGSRSHMNKETLDYIEKLKERYNKEVQVVSKGSSLKFCLIAEGNADLYPRFAPTMEWDTAAGQAICEAVGLKVVDMKTGKPMLYNREDLLNDYFLVNSL